MSKISVNLREKWNVTDKKFNLTGENFSRNVLLLSLIVDLQKSKSCIDSKKKKVVKSKVKSEWSPT